MQRQNVLHSLTIISQATDFWDALISLRVKPPDTYRDTGHFASHSGFKEVPFSLLALLLQWYKIIWAAHACWQWRGGGGETAEGKMSGNRDGGGRDVPPHPFPLMHFTKHPNTILHHTANTYFKSVTDLSWYTEQHWSTILGRCIWAQFFYTDWMWRCAVMSWNLWTSRWDSVYLFLNRASLCFSVLVCLFLWHEMKHEITDEIKRWSNDHCSAFLDSNNVFW